MTFSAILWYCRVTNATSLKLFREDTMRILLDGDFEKALENRTQNYGFASPTELIRSMIRQTEEFKELLEETKAPPEQGGA